MAELELGNVYGPTGPVRLVAATLDPSKLDPDNTWYLATSLSLQEASPEQVYEIYRLRDWIEHYSKPAKHELGWADYQMRPEQAIVRHWHLVMLAFTFSLLMGSPPTPQASTTPAASLTAAEAAGEKRGTRRRETAESPPRPCAQCANGSVPGPVCSSDFQRWTSAAPPPELAALLDHVARSLPLAAPT